MKINNRGYVVPIAIGVLVVASLGLLLFSWWSGSRARLKEKLDTTSQIMPVTTSDALSNQLSANDDATLDSDSANIDAQIKALDNSDIDIGNSLNDKSSI